MPERRSILLEEQKKGKLSFSYDRMHGHDDDDDDEHTGVTATV